MSGGINLHFVPRNSNDRELCSQRVNAQIVAPSQLNLTNSTGNLPRPLLRSRPARKGHLTIHDHEKSRAGIEVPAPGYRTLPGNRLCHCLHKLLHTTAHGGRISGG
jgi:hypothetical protein